MPKPAPYGFAVIFDMDGVLVDSEPLTMRAYVQAATEFGIRLDEEEFVRHFVIEGTLIRSFFEERAGGAADWEDFFRRKTQIYRRLVDSELKRMPGAVELLAELSAKGVPRALATSAARVTMDLVLGASGLASYFEVTISLEDVARPKPDPEAFVKAAGLLGAPAGRCIVIEDALKGVVAAKAAGMKCVAVETLNAEPEWVTVLIEEYESDRGNWAVGGELLIDRFGSGERGRRC